MAAVMAERRILPSRRANETFEMTHGEKPKRYKVTVSYFPDEPKDLAEIFIVGAKAGSEMDAVARDGAILVSIALQHGIPIETIRHSLTHNADGTPSTIIGAVLAKIIPKKD